LTTGKNSGIIPGMTLIEQSVGRVQAWLAKQGHKSRVQIAEQVDIDEKTLRLAKNADWDPRASTLRKLEPLVPRRRRKAEQSEQASAA
jgi:hypothetical protein